MPKGFQDKSHAVGRAWLVRLDAATTFSSGAAVAARLSPRPGECHPGALFFEGASATKEFAA